MDFVMYNLFSILITIFLCEGQEEDISFAIALRNITGTQGQNFWKVFQQINSVGYRSMGDTLELEILSLKGVLGS